jgi:hypothetical protein
MEQQVQELPFTLLSRDDDADGDGLSNHDEERVGTDLRHPDTDGDGYIDGLEIVRAYNPLVPSPADKVSFEGADPTVVSASASLAVTGVRIDREDDTDVLVITGSALPDRLVTLMVFSAPRTVLIRSDGSGRFRLVVGDTLEEGEHTAYAAMTDAEGEILEVSAPYSFVRTAVGITNLTTPTPEAEALPESARGFSWIPLAAVIAFIPLLVFIGLGVYAVWRRLHRVKRRVSDRPSSLDVPPDL